jgi:hypothetical protein
MTALGLNATERATLDDAIRLVEAREEADDRRLARLQERGHITPDDCDRCGGSGCLACIECAHCKPRTPDYVQDAVARWRP